MMGAAITSKVSVTGITVSVLAASATESAQGGKTRL